MSRQEVAPTVCGLRQRRQPTKAAVDRSFSMLNKLQLSKTETFYRRKISTICACSPVYYNSSAN